MIFQFLPPSVTYRIMKIFNELFDFCTERALRVTQSLKHESHLPY